MTEASHVLWGSTRINSDRLIFEGTTGVKGIVPASAASQDKIFIITNDGEAKEILGTQPTIELASGDAIKVGDLENVKAAAGDTITVTGENFFRVTNVNFGQTQASFKVRSSREIEVTIPVGAEATGLSVSSSIRPSASNFNSGISSNNFVAVPQVVSVSPPFQVPGQPITVSGSSFASVTGIDSQIGLLERLYLIRQKILFKQMFPLVKQAALYLCYYLTGQQIRAMQSRLSFPI